MWGIKFFLYIIALNQLTEMKGEGVIIFLTVIFILISSFDFYKALYGG